VHRRTSLAVIPQELEKKRPVRVAARRQREMMVVLSDILVLIFILVLVLVSFASDLFYIISF
jgi:hypothetical protein